jgi:hypothetical protein
MKPRRRTRPELKRWWYARLPARPLPCALCGGPGAAGRKLGRSPEYAGRLALVCSDCAERYGRWLSADAAEAALALPPLWSANDAL